MQSIAISNIYNNVQQGNKNFTLKFYVEEFVPEFLKTDNGVQYGGDKINIRIKKKITDCDFLGNGSYGTVYKITIDNKVYAIKLSDNEIPNKLVQRYNSLIENEKMEKYIIKIYSCGMLKKSSKYKYYCLMEYGGNTLKSIINKNVELNNLTFVLKQLYEIAYLVSKYRLLITDFKLGNITVDKDYKLKLIDIYMDCKTYSPCTECKIVKTYSTVELEKEKRIYESKYYNYSSIFVPLSICIIDIICKKPLSHHCKTLCKKYGVNIGIKQFILLLQIASYNYFNESNNSIKSYLNVINFKLSMEQEFPFIKSKSFYEYFINLLEPKEICKQMFTKKKIFYLIGDILTIDINNRSLKYFKHIIF